MTALNDIKVLKYYPYRKARAIRNTNTLPREYVTAYEKLLADLAGVRPDNHVCYQVDTCQCFEKPKFYMFTDFWMIVGDEILEKSW